MITNEIHQNIELEKTIESTISRLESLKNNLNKRLISNLNSRSIFEVLTFSLVNLTQASKNRNIQRKKLEKLLLRIEKKINLRKESLAKVKNEKLINIQTYLTEVDTNFKLLMIQYNIFTKIIETYDQILDWIEYTLKYIDELKSVETAESMGDNIWIQLWAHVEDPKLKDCLTSLMEINAYLESIIFEFKKLNISEEVKDLDKVIVISETISKSDLELNWTDLNSLSRFSNVINWLKKEISSSKRYFKTLIDRLTEDMENIIDLHKDEIPQSV